MKRQLAKKIVSELAQSAGVTLNGNQPWDIQIHNEQFYDSILHGNTLALGEAYMNKWWDCASLDNLFEKLIHAGLEQKIKKDPRLLFKIAFAKLINLQTKNRAFEVGEKHYDLSNLLFQKMLDSRMNYTCAYWNTATTLEEAQLAKLELVCKKIQLQPGMRVLDIGCGWGAFAKYAAEKYGVNVVGVTISKQQIALAQQLCEGLPIEIRLQDYRDLNHTHEKFDRIVSLGMFEHVGHLNYHTYMQTAHHILNDHGLFLLHTIGSNHTTVRTDEWISKYIFPNGMLPSIAQIGKASEPFFFMEDWHNFGVDYDRTLMSWHHNFNANWDTLKPYFDERFYRMWNYYLLTCAGGFRAHAMQLWQIVFSKNGTQGRYTAPR